MENFAEANLCMQKKPFSFGEIFPRAERFDLNYFQFPECSPPLTSAPNWVYLGQGIHPVSPYKEGEIVLFTF